MIEILDGRSRLFGGDCRDVLRSIEASSVQTCVTSPPYFGLRDYGVDGQIGHEPTIGEFVAAMVDVFREVRRVLRDDGTLWLNLGDSYNAAGRIGHGGRVGYKQGTNRASAVGADQCRPSVESLKPKDLIGIPWRVAFALQADGWYLRSDIIWHKPNPMPESVTDRPTSAHEHVFLLAKRECYFYDADAVREPFTYAAETRVATPKNVNGLKLKPTQEYGHKLETEGRNLRNVWTIPTQPFRGAHFATFPPALIEPCIKAGSRQGDVVLDPFGGSGTTGVVAERLGRRSVLIDLNPKNVAMARARIVAETSASRIESAREKAGYLLPASDLPLFGGVE